MRILYIVLIMYDHESFHSVNDLAISDDTDKRLDLILIMIQMFSRTCPFIYTTFSPKITNTTNPGASESWFLRSKVNKTNIVETGEEINEVSKLVHAEDLEDGNLNVNRYVFPEQLDIEGYGTVRFDVAAYEDMPTIPLGDVAKLFRGYNVGSQSEEREDGTFKIVRLSDVEDGQIKLENVTRYDIKAKARTSMYELNKGDVILSIRGQTLKVAVVPVSEENLLLSQNFIGIRCHPQLDPYFLKMFLESPLGQYLLTNRMSGTAIPTLSRKDIERLKIPLQPIDKQRELREQYYEQESYIFQEIERLEKQLRTEKLLAFEKMGLKGTFQIEG